MKARFLKQVALDELRSNVNENLSYYRSGDFSFLETDPSFSFEYDINVNVSALGSLKPPQAGNLFEPVNCENVYGAMSELSPYEARDERFWAYLSHTYLLEYGRERWPIPENDASAVAHINKHFFAKDKRQIERDNVGSRLWWMAHLCARVKTLDPKEALEAFLFKSDVRANLVERPTTSQTANLFGALLDKLVMSYKGERKLFERRIFRQLMMEVNSVGGFKLLDCLNAKTVESIVSNIITQKLELSVL